ncbi:MAG: hypothetical protein QGF46_06130, partial [Planctomycetota bacterium]|nr:hypothetical protein [Planctomycetota bacterium]
VLCDALLQLAVRSRNLDVRLACLLAPDQVPRRYVPALAQISLSSEIDLSLRALACARIIENGFYSAWPLARAILLTGTATDSEQGHPYPDWRRSGRYELPKRLLCIQLQKVFKQRHQAAFVFEPNAAWKIQEQQIAAIDAQLKRFQPPRVESSFQVLANSKHPLAPAITDLLGLD